MRWPRISAGTGEGLPREVEAACARLARDLLDIVAARELRQTAAAARCGGPALAALVEVCDVLDGDGAWNPDSPAPRTRPLLDESTHQSLVLHPREKQERRHELA